MQDAGVYHQLANVGTNYLWYMSPGAQQVGPIFRNTNLTALTTTLQQFSTKRTSDYDCRNNHGASCRQFHTFGPASPTAGRVRKFCQRSAARRSALQPRHGSLMSHC